MNVIFSSIIFLIDLRDLGPVEGPHPEGLAEDVVLHDGDLDVAVVEEASLVTQDVLGEELCQLEDRKQKG